MEMFPEAHRFYSQDSQDTFRPSDRVTITMTAWMYHDPTWEENTQSHTHFVQEVGVSICMKLYPDPDDIDPRILTLPKKRERAELQLLEPTADQNTDL